ncbi:DUF1772 domain-containing protein [Terriglobus albidus]|uniref:DUF1772 domain-containing protein n=1 Tax=Terriglobus albidus TaxID=1592106 RepID=A0A5B9EI33_9BACT|nr:anthrone oxygenase family protein [Terriglobus albidus]QEE30121.1 DUF1772 domain-containing protein [Terriglobus albidus]
MSPRVIVPLTLFCIAGSAADGGAYFAFSTFVMQGLQRLPVDAAVTAMQQIDLTAVNPWFALALFGTGLASLALATQVIRKQPGRSSMLTAVALYLLSLAVTFGCNVPLNNTLASADAHAANAAQTWAAFYNVWMLWNHTRTILALASTVFFAIALARYEQGETA